MMPNKYGVYCHQCKSWVGPEAGFLDGKFESGRYRVACADCSAEAATSYRFDAKVEADPPPFNWRDDPIIAALLRLRAERLRQLEAERYRPRCLTILGLMPPVDAPAIQSQFRRLAMTCHPDHGGDPRQFMELRSARDEALLLASGGRS